MVVDCSLTMYFLETRLEDYSLDLFSGLRLLILLMDGEYCSLHKILSIRGCTSHGDVIADIGHFQ